MNLSWAYSPASLLLQRGRGLTPDQVPDLGLWLKSDAGVTLVGGAVDAWADQSGNGRDFSAAGASNRPAYSDVIAGKTVLTFDGTDDYLVGNAANAGLTNNIPGLTIFAAIRLATGADQRFYSVTTNVPPSGRVSAGVTTTQWQVGGRRLNADTFQNVTGGTSNNNFVIHCGLLRYSAATAAIFINGVSQVDTSFQTAGNTESTDGTNTYIGCGSTVANFLNGHIGEIIVYRRAVTPIERAQITAYLSQRWNIPAI